MVGFDSASIRSIFGDPATLCLGWGGRKLAKLVCRNRGAFMSLWNKTGPFVKTPEKDINSVNCPSISFQTHGKGAEAEGEWEREKDGGSSCGPRRKQRRRSHRFAFPKRDAQVPLGGRFLSLLQLPSHPLFFRRPETPPPMQDPLQGHLGLFFLFPLSLPRPRTRAHALRLHARKDPRKSLQTLTHHSPILFLSLLIVSSCRQSLSLVFSLHFIMLLQGTSIPRVFFFSFWHSCWKQGLV